MSVISVISWPIATGRWAQMGPDGPPGSSGCATRWKRPWTSRSSWPWVPPCAACSRERSWRHRTSSFHVGTFRGRDKGTGIGWCMPCMLRYAEFGWSFTGCWICWMLRCWDVEMLAVVNWAAADWEVVFLSVLLPKQRLLPQKKEYLSIWWV